MSVLPSIKTDSVVYFMRENRIHKGVVKARFDLDSINSKYLIETPYGKRWMMDSAVFKSIPDLIVNLKSCIIG